MDNDCSIDINELIDLDSLTPSKAGHYTFFAFPLSTMNKDGLPSDPDAQRYIAAIQTKGVPVGICLNSPTDNTGYAAVTHDNIDKLNDAIAGLTRNLSRGHLVDY